MDELNLDIEKIDTSKDDDLADYKQWGSPAILLDEKDITDYQMSDGEHCRYYAGEKNGVLSVETIRKLIQSRLD